MVKSENIYKWLKKKTTTYAVLCKNHNQFVVQEKNSMNNSMSFRI